MSLDSCRMHCLSRVPQPADRVTVNRLRLQRNTRGSPLSPQAPRMNLQIRTATVKNGSVISLAARNTAHKWPKLSCGRFFNTVSRSAAPSNASNSEEHPNSAVRNVPLTSFATRLELAGAGGLGKKSQKRQSETRIDCVTYCSLLNLGGVKCPNRSRHTNCGIRRSPCAEWVLTPTFCAAWSITSSKTLNCCSGI